MPFNIVTSGMQMIPAPSGGGGGVIVNTPAFVLLTGQGNGAANLTNRQDIAWTAPTGNTNPLNHYEVWRNGSFLANTAATSYSDLAAPNSNDNSYNTSCVPYYYQVLAVDSLGNKGALSVDMRRYEYWGSQGGKQNTEADASFGMVAENYSDTSGAPIGGGVDCRLDYGGGWQMTTGNPNMPTWDLECGGFTSGGGGFLNFSCKPVQSGVVLSFGIISRFPFGDVFNFKGPGDISVYVTGPVAGVLTAGVWNTIKIPMPALSMGYTTFTGSIGAPYGSDGSGPWATLTTSGEVGVNVDFGGYIISGAPANTRIGRNGVGGTDPHGIFPVQGPGITGSTVIGPTTMITQRTVYYKNALIRQGGPANPTVYVNDYFVSRV